MSIDRDIVSAKRFVQDFGLAEIPMFFDKSGEAARNFKINMVPQYLLFRNDGQLMRRWAGLSHYNAKLGKMQHPSDIFRSIDGSP